MWGMLNATVSCVVGVARGLFDWLINMVFVVFQTRNIIYFTSLVSYIHRTCLVALFLSHQALDGFLMVISREGRILYVSESISHFLGLRQVRP